MLRNVVVRWTLSMAALGICATTVYAAPGPNLLGNPGFESPAVTSIGRFRQDHTIGLCGAGALANHPQPGCWTVLEGSVDLTRPGTIPAYSGSQYIDLNGTAKGFIGQQVVAQPGLAYELIFFGRSSRSQNMTVNASIYWYNAAGSIISNSPILAAQTASGAWTRFRVESASPTGTAFGRIYLRSMTQLLAPYAGYGPLVDGVVFRTY
jgi:hypothetical protein